MPTLTTASLAGYAAERIADLRTRATEHVDRARVARADADAHARTIDDLLQQLDRQREIALLAHVHGDSAVADRIGADVRTLAEELIAAAYQCRQFAIGHRAGHAS